MEFSITWENAKTLIDENSFYYYRKLGLDSYEIFIQETCFIVNICSIKLGSEDQADYDDNYKAAEGQKTYLQDSFYFTATKETSTGYAFKLSDPDNEDIEGFIYSGYVMTNDKASFGDYFKIEISDEDNILEGGAGAILATLIKKRYVLAGSNITEILPASEDFLRAKKKIPAGLYIKITYTSTGATDDVKVRLGASYEY